MHDCQDENRGEPQHGQLGFGAGCCSVSEEKEIGGRVFSVGLTDARCCVDEGLVLPLRRGSAPVRLLRWGSQLPIRGFRLVLFRLGGSPRLPSWRNGRGRASDFGVSGRCLGLSHFPGAA